VNDVPVVQKNEAVTLPEGKTAAITSQRLAVSDVDNTPAELVYTLTRSPENGSLMLDDSTYDDSAAFTQKNIDDGLLRYTHDGSETTNDNMAFSLADGNGGTIAEIILPVTVTAVNDTPYIAAKLEVSVVEGGAKTISSATLIVRDNDNTADELTFTMLKAPLHGTLKLSGTALDAGGTFTQEDIDSSLLTYQHNKGSSGTTDSLTFSVRDKSGATIAETVLRIRIGAVDDPPVALDQSVSLNEDGSLVITLSATDPEGSAIAGWEIPVSPRHGTLTGSGAVRTYTPEPDFFGADTFTFRANDLVNWSDTGVIAITVLPVNDAPQWKQSSVELSVKEGKTITSDLQTVFDKDPDGDDVTYTKKSGPGSIASGSNVWSWSPGFNAAAASPASCIITATDNGSPAKSADITLTITVTDSLCRLTTSVANGSGTIQVQGGQTMFDPGTEVRITANPGSDYVFKNWRGDATGTDSTTTIIMDRDKSVEAVFVKDVETVTLNISQMDVHGFKYIGGYYFACTHTLPSKLLRFNADDLSEYSEITFTPDHYAADELVYASSTKKIYLVFAYSTVLRIAEIDPYTMEYNEDKIVDTKNYTSGGQTITTDNEYLYVGARYTQTDSKIIKYSLSTFSNTPSAEITLVPAFGRIHAMQYQDGFLWATGTATPPWILKVNTTDLSIDQEAFIDGIKPTDDFAYTGSYVFVGLETDYTHEKSGVIYRISTADIAQMYPIYTGKKGGVNEGIGHCYGVQYYGGYVWAVFATSPGTLTKIDPVSLEYTNYRLEYNIPNEIAWDGRRLCITYWDQDPGIIQAFALQYLEGRESP
ncbi:MAG: hypothetical protein GF401_01305, partial [Chitinivibrionales bacterium]|nr:hypothetical protein [Chitinivibrionales bacterium]